MDSHLSFETLDRSAPLYTLDYVQPRCPPALYPSEVTPASSTVAPSPTSWVVIEDDDASASPALVPVDPPTSPSVIDMQHLSSTIQSLMNAVQRITSSSPPAPLPTSPLVADPPIAPQLLADTADLPSMHLLSTMPLYDILHLVHHPDTSFPSVRPCDTSNASDTKTHWTSEELHRTMGCHKFRNYKHLLQVSRWRRVPCLSWLLCHDPQVPSRQTTRSAEI